MIDWMKPENTAKVAASLDGGDQEPGQQQHADIEADAGDAMQRSTSPWSA